MIFIYLGDRLWFLSSGECTLGEVVNFYDGITGIGGIGVRGQKHVIQFSWQGKTFQFSTSILSSVRMMEKDIPVIFDPNNPLKAYEYSFPGFWAMGLLIIGIAIVPWSAISLSFIGTNEVLVLSRNKIGLEKTEEKNEDFD
ncbi:MAG TPA: hypothetical protein VL651_13060 [Bacteroidia bacterium]|nr:hypothetical protein [Bacteroidia bacterium]